MIALLEQSHGSRLMLEVGVWLLPTALGALAFARAARGEGLTWLFSALACATIVVDKTADLQHRLSQAGRRWVATLDPQSHLRGGRLPERLLLLGAGLSLFLLLLLALLRFDRGRRAPRLLCLAGFGLLGAYLAARFVPSVGKALDPPLGLWIEGAALLSIVLGQLLGFERRGRA